MKTDKIVMVFIFIAIIMLSGCSDDLQTEYPNPSDLRVPATDDVPSPPSAPIAEDIPDSIVRSADNIIISKVGKENFERYYTFDGGAYLQGDEHQIGTATFFAEPHYALYYTINDFRFTLVVDETGEHGHVPLPVPDCTTHPSECVFIDKSEAVDIAQQHNLEKGVEPWDIQFGWDLQKSTYVWHVISFLTGRIRGEGQCSDETVMSIDANSGEIADIRKGGLCS